MTILKTFSDTVKQYPSKVAVMYSGGEFTFQEVDVMSNFIAKQLRSYVKPVETISQLLHETVFRPEEGHPRCDALRTVHHSDLPDPGGRGFGPLRGRRAQCDVDRPVVQHFLLRAVKRIVSASAPLLLMPAPNNALTPTVEKVSGSGAEDEPMRHTHRNRLCTANAR